MEMIRSAPTPEEADFIATAWQRDARSQRPRELGCALMPGAIGATLGGLAVAAAAPVLVGVCAGACVVAGVLASLVLVRLHRTVPPAPLQAVPIEIVRISLRVRAYHRRTVHHGDHSLLLIDEDGRSFVIPHLETSGWQGGVAPRRDLTLYLSDKHLLACSADGPGVRPMEAAPALWDRVLAEAGGGAWRIIER